MDAEIGNETKKQFDHCFVSKQGFKNVDSCFTVSKEGPKKHDSCFTFRNKKQENETTVSKQFDFCQSLGPCRYPVTNHFPKVCGGKS